MANGNGNGAAMERAVESIALRGWARLSMVIFPPLTVAAILWLANSQNETTKAVIKIEGQLAPIIRDQAVMQQQIEQSRSGFGDLKSRVDAHVGRHDNTDRRLDGIDQRNREQDNEIRDIQRRVWQMPEAVIPPGRPR